MEIKGIDVSSYQGNIDWATVANYGMGFAILRITEKNNKVDSKFEQNYKGCIKYNVPVGVYKYSYALTVADIQKEAQTVIDVLDGRKLDFPVWLDLEDSTQKTLSTSMLDTLIKTFWSVVTAAGYKFGIYCNADWYENVIPESAKSKYDFWIARYPAEDNGWLQERLRPSYGVGWQYSSKAVIPGISGKVDRNVFYKDYKEDKEDNNMGVTAQDVLNVMRSWLGCSEANGKYKQIIDLYNSHKPLARGYAVKYTDEWCDTTVSAAAIKAGAVDLIGTECGVEEHVKIFQKKGIWIEDGTITPKPGDIIVYNWGDNTQPNDGYSDHIGYVETVSGKTITAIEGNKGEAVARRTVTVGHGNIRGYARPKYATESSGSSGNASVPAGKSGYTCAPDIVQLGSTGLSVLLLQEILLARGFKGKDGKALTLDRSAGENTIYALKQYQKSRNGYLEADGVCGTDTWKDLIAIE